MGFVCLFVCLFVCFEAGTGEAIYKYFELSRRQRGRVVRVLDFESVGLWFESHSEHFVDLFTAVPSY